MKRLEGYLLELRNGGRDGFLAAHAHGFLLTTLEPVAPDEWGDFHTDAVHADMAKLAAQLTPAEARAIQRAEDYRVLELTKSPDNPWRGRISIGRARNTDVIINDASVSKLHAHISETEDGATLTDAGSRNGSQLNGERIPPSKAMPLNAGDRVVLGTVAVTFHSSESFADFLSELMRAT